VRPREAALEAALRGIESLEARADAVAGMVDAPHAKALRAACEKARAALALPVDEGDEALPVLKRLLGLHWLCACDGCRKAKRDAEAIVNRSAS
jgi:hypothetical protein